MKVYVGQTSPDKFMGLRATTHGWGEMLVRGDVFPPKRTPWALDNGAYREWRRDLPFAGDKWIALLGRLDEAPCPPDFVILPDIPAGGCESLRFSKLWQGKTSDLLEGQRLYLPVQDGMSHADVEPALDGVAGLFVGGSNEWKLDTGEGWVQLAHGNGLPCHVGRVGVPYKVAWAYRIGVDSIDSCVPLRDKQKYYRFIRALDQQQVEMFKR